MQTETQTRPAWWEDTSPIPMAAGPSLDDTQIVVRGQSAPVRGRSEYAELAELAAAHGPRDTTAMLREARRVGQLLADRAFYLFPPLKEPGPTIDLMDALAAVWGRVVARVEILDETHDRVHLRGRVVDLLALTAVERDYMSSLAPAPGKFAKDREQSDRWRVMQLQSASSKAIRGALVHALPAWLVDAAMDAARAEAARIATGGATLPVARAKAADHLATKYGLDRPVLEALLGVAVDLWTAQELGALNKIAKQLAAGEVAPEAIRAQVAQAGALAPAAEPAGRLAGLGLGNPGPAPASAPVQQSTPPSSQPAASEAPPASEPAAHQTGAAPASGGPSPSRPDPEQEQREKYLAAIKELEAQVPAATKDGLRTEHGLMRIFPRTADLGKLSRLVAGLRAAVAAQAESAEPADDWDGPTGQELVDECGELLRSLEPEQRAACMRSVGLRPEETPSIEYPEATLRKLLVALVDAVPVEG